MKPIRLPLNKAVTLESRNIAVIYSKRNKRGMNDARGAFIPEARAFQLVHGVPDNNMCGVDCINQTTEFRRRQVLEHIYALGRNEPLDGIVFFCHGWPNGIQCGFNRKNLHELVTVISNSAHDYLEIALYACLTAENDVRDNQVKNIGPATEGGFADLLSLGLAQHGVSGHVDAHKESGHTTWCPFVVRFQNTIMKENAAWLVEPGSESWQSWIKAIQGSNLRFEFPFMSELQIKNQLVDMVVV